MRPELRPDFGPDGMWDARWTFPTLTNSFHLSSTRREWYHGVQVLLPFEVGTSMVCRQRATKVMNLAVAETLTWSCWSSSFADNFDGCDMRVHVAVRLTPDADYMNFDNILWALLVVFQCMTMEGWCRNL